MREETKAMASAASVIFILLAAALIIPLSGKVIDEGSFDRMPRTVSVGETNIYDAFYESGFDPTDYYLDDQGCKVFSADISRDEIYSDGSQEDAHISISVSPANDISVYTSDGNLCLGIFRFEPVIDREGNMTDVLLDSGGNIIRASDYFSDVENCFFPAIVIGGAGVLYLALIAAVAVCAVLILEDGTNVALEFPKINLTDRFYKHKKIVDGIDIIKLKDKVVGVEINGTKYNFSNDYKNNTDKSPGKYYFTYVMKDRVYIFPKDIGASCAKKIINLQKRENEYGKYSVFTISQNDAYDIAFAAKNSIPVGPEIHGSLAEGYLYHYHTFNHLTPAHVFFSTWR